MAELSDLPLWEQLFLKSYPYRRAQWTQPAPAPPARQARLALITTAAFTLPEQAPFDPSLKGGDYSFRWLPRDTDVRTLRTSHRSSAFDRRGILADPNLAFPLDRLRELEAEGLIGSLNQRHLSFMGSITAPARLMQRSVPEAVEGLRQDGVEAALLVPV